MICISVLQMFYQMVIWGQNETNGGWGGGVRRDYIYHVMMYGQYFVYHDLNAIDCIL